MSEVEGGERERRGADRLVYGYVGGRHRGPYGTALTIMAAQAIDRSLGRIGFARPALLVSGFWRSGTTWLQESLAAALGGKTAFEPLSPMEPHRRATLTREAPRETEDLRQATIPGPQPPGSAFWCDMDRACTGARSSSYLLSCRHGVRESFCRDVIVKDVRLQANLAEFNRRYSVPVVHIRRHPCAVVASLLAADWHWSFARLDLATLLTRLGDASGHTERVTALRFDTDTISRIAAFWAVTERIAEAELRGRSGGLVLTYETFAAEPNAVLEQACEALGISRRHAVDFSRPSASIDPAVFAGYRAQARERWRHQLSREQIGRIRSVADAMFPDWRVRSDDD